jgi:hypothetical protein
MIWSVVLEVEFFEGGWHICSAVSQEKNRRNVPLKQIGRHVASDRWLALRQHSTLAITHFGGDLEAHVQ